MFLFCFVSGLEHVWKAYVLYYNLAGQVANDLKGEDSVPQNEDDVTGNECFFWSCCCCKKYIQNNSSGFTENKQLYARV